jgi:hypothetical protein
LGFASNYHQEHLYAQAAKRHGGRAPPEARLYWAAYGGLMFPLAMFAFAWTGRPGVPWQVPAVLLCISNWGVYCMYSGVLCVNPGSHPTIRPFPLPEPADPRSNYLADAYETYSSSAQAAQSFARNIFSGVFPLFAHQMVSTPTNTKAGTRSDTD